MPVIFINYPFSSNDLSILMLEKNQVFKFVFFFSFENIGAKAFTSFRFPRKRFFGK